MTHRCGPKLSSVSSMVSYYNSKGFRNTEVLGLRDKPSFHLKEKTVVISEVNKQTNLGLSVSHCCRFASS